jgi:hypothetical protein
MEYNEINDEVINAALMQKGPEYVLRFFNVTQLATVINANQSNFHCGVQKNTMYEQSGSLQFASDYNTFMSVLWVLLAYLIVQLKLKLEQFLKSFY